MPGCLAACLIFALFLGGSFCVLSTRPDLAAQGADFLRAVLGNQAVARLEMVLFQVQDTAQKIEYALGLAAPEPPWKSAPVLRPTITRVALPTVVSTASTSAAAAAASTAASSPGNLAAPSPAAAASIQQPPAQPSSTPAPIHTPAAWPPQPLKPLGSLEAEGQWSPYITAADGRVVAYRAFLQPDPERPFAVLAVIAFDLEHTRLHYILGFEEPYSPSKPPGEPPRTGAMPAADKAPGLLLAMFNGGFKATHGHFGAMSGGITALPPIPGLGTLVIYQDGRVRLGVWGSSIQPSADMQSWRQNGPLVIEDGQINPRISNNSPKDWGYTVNDVSPTWRSAIGLSADGKTLYYLAGSSLSMESLARGMQAAGIAQGMQLDINAYWVHFVAVRDDGDQRALEPLFPKMMKENIDRYLYQYSRDYFYVTGIP